MARNEFLLEIFSEEIPARMQAQAARDAAEISAAFLKENGVKYQTLETHITPQRLVIMVQGLEESTEAQVEERRGPRVDAPEAAVQGFLRSAGLTLDQCVRKQTDKGEFWFAYVTKAQQTVAEILAALVPHILQTLVWPKSMRWQASPYQWVRPIRRILALYQGQPLALNLPFLTVPTGNVTQGHRFLAPQLFTVSSIADYQDQLAKHHVILNAVERRAKIWELAQQAARAQRLTVREDEALLDEVTGLVEWPEALIGDFEAHFLQLPPAVLITSMRHHQKFFTLLDSSGKLAAKFLTIINTIPQDKGQEIIRGNQRVLRARLADAVFFDHQDRQKPLAEYVPKLASVTFHAKLGDMLAKVQRVQRLAMGAVAEMLKIADVETLRHIDQAAQLAKADLVTSMVGEFPELQGVIGGTYAHHSGEPGVVCSAIADQYAPSVPTPPVTLALALADRLDTLAGFFSIGEIPSGSKDPFALRRAALGVIRLLIDNQQHADIQALCMSALQGYSADAEAVRPGLIGFFEERLRVLLRGMDLRYDIVEAVLQADTVFDPWILQARAVAMNELVPQAMAQTVIGAWRRVGNIMRSVDQADIAQAVDHTLFKESAEHDLWQQVRAIVWPETTPHTVDDCHALLRSLVALQPAINTFFDTVTVNCPEQDVRANRLALVRQVQHLVSPLIQVNELEG